MNVTSLRYQRIELNDCPLLSLISSWRDRLSQLSQHPNFFWFMPERKKFGQIFSKFFVTLTNVSPFYAAAVDDRSYRKTSLVAKPDELFFQNRQHRRCQLGLSYKVVIVGRSKKKIQPSKLVAIVAIIAVCLNKNSSLCCRMIKYLSWEFFAWFMANRNLQRFFSVSSLESFQTRSATLS